MAVMPAQRTTNSRQPKTADDCELPTTNDRRPTTTNGRHARVCIQDRQPAGGRVPHPSPGLARVGVFSPTHLQSEGRQNPARDASPGTRTPQHPIASAQTTAATAHSWPSCPHNAQPIAANRRPPTTANYQRPTTEDRRQRTAVTPACVSKTDNRRVAHPSPVLA